MKNIVKLIVLASTLVGSAQVLDLECFGSQLGGWTNDKEYVKSTKGDINHLFAKKYAKGDNVTYKLDDVKYRTFKPTETAGPDGTAFISTRIETESRVGSGAVCFLETTFSADRQLIAASVKINTDDRRIDSGTVVLQLPIADEESFSPIAPTTQLIIDLFSALDGKIEKLNQNTEEDIARRDLFGRTGRLTWELEDISAAVRHNLNILLGCATGSSGDVYYTK